MCNNCYHSNGRNKKAWKCLHIEKAHYAQGVCQTCYHSKYTSKGKKVIEDLKCLSSHNNSNIELEEKIYVEENKNNKIKNATVSFEDAKLNNKNNNNEKCENIKNVKLVFSVKIEK
jgi:hypothetical protein